MKKIIFFTSLIILLISCNNKMEEFVGTVKDYTGLDGCGLVIELNNGLVLEPYKLPAGVTLEVGRKVIVRYKTLQDRASICMVGPIVEITMLRYL